ncbi:glycerophosphodiester phosphodiesterase [Streptomyces sp. NBC_00019]|uniref:glycerophosphodiester phosphodiesterase n=1 Tax=Streptomyces sp. NBC_00019 TaxID=2975623 RepID=UPI00324A6A44
MVTRIALTGLASAASLVSLLGPTIPLEWGPGPLTVDSLPRVTYVAHRGGAREVPENSLTGLMAAYGRGTAHVLDFDTRMLSDGTLVVMHDPLLNRTTYLGGEVHKLNVREWQGVRVRPKAPLPGSWRSERPPTVAQVLDLLGGLWRSAQQLRTDRPERWRSFVDVLDVDYRARDADLVRAVNSGVRRVWAHTVVTSAQRDRVLGLGCDGVITDTPGRLARAPQRVAQRGARP